jgi:hypothetical protein
MPEQILQRGRLLSICIGALVFTFYGGLWAIAGLISLGMLDALVLVITLGLIMLFLLIAIVVTMRKVLHLPQEELSLVVRQRVSRIKRLFALINVFQAIAIIGTMIIASRIHRPEFIMPAIALIVGLHFFVLAPVLEMRIDYLIGTLLSLLVVMTILVLPVQANVSGTSHRFFVWGFVTGIGSAVLLWLGAIARLLKVKSALSQTR